MKSEDLPLPLSDACLRDYGHRRKQLNIIGIDMKAFRVLVFVLALFVGYIAALIMLKNMGVI